MATFKEPSLTHRGRRKAAGERPAVDLTHRPRPEPRREGLADTDRRFRLFVERVRDYAIFMLDPAGRVATWNDGAERIKGYPAQEIIGQHMSRFYTPEDIERGLPEQLLKTAETEGRADSEGWRVRKDGSRFWAEVSITALHDEQGQLQGFGKVTHDLTERRQAEEALRGLSWRLVEAQDRERKRIAVSLNDSTSPGFAALISKLYEARKRTEGAAAYFIDDGLALAQFLAREIRTVSYLLHPSSLESEGLLAALHAYLDALAKQRGIVIDVGLPAQLDRLPQPTELALYRVVQECLTSLLHVTGNSRAKARLTVDEGHLTLEVGSEGRGISPEALAEARQGVGELGVAIAGMRERMKRLGGSLQLISTGSGTRVRATLPLNPPPRGGGPESQPAGRPSSEVSAP